MHGYVDIIFQVLSHEYVLKQYSWKFFWCQLPESPSLMGVFRHVYFKWIFQHHPWHQASASICFLNTRVSIPPITDGLSGKWQTKKNPKVYNLLLFWSYDNQLSIYNLQLTSLFRLYSKIFQYTGTEHNFCPISYLNAYTEETCSLRNDNLYSIDYNL